MSRTCTRCGGSGRIGNNETPQLTFTSAAKLIREAAKECRERRLTWPGDSEMQNLCIEDARDLRNIAKLLREENAAAACHWGNAMDTAARDWIPIAVWNFMEHMALVDDAFSKLASRRSRSDTTKVSPGTSR